MARFAFVLSLLLVLALLAAPASAAAGKAAAGDAVPSVQAKERLAALEKALKSRRTSVDDALAAFDEALAAYRHPAGDAKARDRFRKAADKVIARAITAWRGARKLRSVNVLEELAVHAAATLAGLAADVPAKARARLSRAVVRELESKLEAHKHDELSKAWFEATFSALGRLGDDAAFVWLTENHVHTRWRERAQVLAATKALALFVDADVAGALRHQLFKTLLITWEPIEAAAERGGPGDETAKRLWDELRRSVIPLMQKSSGAPTNKDDVALSTLVEFRRWWGDHKNPRKAPWTRKKTK